MVPCKWKCGQLVARDPLDEDRIEHVQTCLKRRVRCKYDKCGAEFLACQDEVCHSLVIAHPGTFTRGVCFYINLMIMTVRYNIGTNI